MLRGAYRLVDARGEPGWDPEVNAVSLFAAGVTVPEAITAQRALRERGILASVFAVTSPDRLYRGLRDARPYLEDLVSADEEGVPVVSVLDGHSHALAFIGAALGCRSRRSAWTTSVSPGRAAICIGTTGSTRPPSRGRRRSCWAGYNSLNPMSTLTDSRKRDLRRELESIVGPGAVLSDPDELMVYESDGLTLFRALADFVVFPTSAQHVSAVVKLANRENLPFVARGAAPGSRADACPPRAAS